MIGDVVSRGHRELNAPPESDDLGETLDYISTLEDL